MPDPPQKYVTIDRDKGTLFSMTIQPVDAAPDENGRGCYGGFDVTEIVMRKLKEESPGLLENRMPPEK